jgi:CDP-diacylglycerol---glycerol-3-phosphate 3-phosphatidyltransferase
MNAATMLTASRIVIAPVFAFTFLHSFRHGTSPLWLVAAVALVILSEITDALDGAVARKRGEVTDFGKVFDPMADSIARLTAFAAFMAAGIIPWWLFLVFLYRDSFLSLLRLAAASQGTVQGARQSGKIKAVVQAAGILLVLVVCLMHAYGSTLVPRMIWGRHPGFWIMLIPALVTILSVFDYLAPTRAAVRQMMTTKKT